MLSGKLVTLRPWKEADIAPMLELRNDIDLQAALMSEARPNSAEKVRRWLTERSDKEDSIFFIVSNRINDKPLGFVQVTGINRRDGTGYLGIGLLPNAQGQGLGVEVIQLLKKYLVDVVGLRKLLLHVLSHNTRALRLYEKTGFAYVGTLSRHHWTVNGYADIVIMEHFLKSQVLSNPIP